MVARKFDLRAVPLSLFIGWHCPSPGHGLREQDETVLPSRAVLGVISSPTAFARRKRMRRDLSSANLQGRLTWRFVIGRLDACPEGVRRELGCTQGRQVLKCSQLAREVDLTLLSHAAECDRKNSVRSRVGQKVFVHCRDFSAGKSGSNALRAL